MEKIFSDHRDEHTGDDDDLQIISTQLLATETKGGRPRKMIVGKKIRMTKV